MMAMEREYFLRMATTGFVESPEVMYLILFLLCIPFVGGIITLAFRRRDADILAALFASLAFCAVLFIIGKVRFGETEFAFGSLPWLGITDLLGFRVDPLSILMLSITTFVGLLVVLYSSFYLSEGNKEHPVEDGKGRYYFWLLFFLGAMIGVSISSNFLELFLFFELTSLCSFALIGFYQHQRALRAGFIALITTSTGSAFFLGALTLLFSFARSFAFDAPAQLPEGLRALFFTLIFVAALAKGSQVPFQIWLPQAMEAPTPISAYLHAAAMVKVGVFLLARTLTSAPLPYGYALGLLVVALSLFSMLISLLAFLATDDIKKLLAYSTILHIGYIALGLGLGMMGSTHAFQGGMLHIINHSVAKSLLFLCAGAVTYVTGTRRISEMGGLGTKMPAVAETFTIGTLAVAGVPPFAAFFSKFFILWGAIELGNWIGTVSAVFIILESAISLAWFIRVTHRVFMGAEAEATSMVNPIPSYINSLLILLAFFTIVAPVLGLYLVRVFTATAGVMMP